MKNQFLVIVFSVVLFLSGCSAKWEGVEASGYKPFRGLSLTADPYQLYTEDLVFVQLRYADKDTAVCWIDNCRHLNSDCPAFYRYPVFKLDTDEQERIYLLDGGSTDAANLGKLPLWRIDPKGQLKEKIAEFSLGMDALSLVFWRNCCVYNETLYVSVQYQQKTEGIVSALLEADLKSGTSSLWIPPDSEGKNIDFLGVDEQAIYWKEDNRNIFRSAKKSGQIAALYQGRESLKDITLVEHWVIYNDVQDGQASIHVYDLKSGQDEEICQAAEMTRVLPSANERMVSIISADDESGQRDYRLDTGEFVS